MRDYQRELELLREKIAQRKEDLAVLAQLEQQEEALQRQVEACHTQWEKEQQDAERLGRVSVDALLALLRGSKEQDLEREQAQVYAARLRLQEAERQLTEIQGEILDRRCRLEKNGNCGHAYEQVLREKEAAVCAANPVLAQHLETVEKRIVELTTRRRELEEVLSAGRQVLFHLSAAIGRLNSAQNLGVWDVLGGGMLVDTMKYTQMNEAQDQMEHLARALRCYQAELSGIGEQLFEMDIQWNGVPWSMDVLLDNLFSDWMVLKKISKAGTQLRELETRISMIQGRLEQERNKTKAALAQACQERDQTVLLA